MKNLITLLVATLFLAACTTIKDAKLDINNHEATHFNQGIDVVWAKTIEIIDASALDLVYADTRNRQIYAQAPISAFSWGENVFIEIRETEPGTSVKISSKRSLRTTVFASDWEATILDELQRSLNDN
ncbi:hypothetical protein FCL40_09450 [Ferrimonas sediminicola]|uniref:Uncharacterized protein n=1 Tax=Ferrimonas sediminicola TaxID=2569538 RepID=A0A4U1BDL8_9GAMM|nr:hypothetical protein [Ferrimonas sediminicola]TKB48858.1 hypothetical protein FCL40_09450 [Ferrimonas sediminicola]